MISFLCFGTERIEYASFIKSFSPKDIIARVFNRSLDLVWCGDRLNPSCLVEPRAGGALGTY